MHHGVPSCAPRVTRCPSVQQGDTAAAERILHMISRLNRKPLPATMCISKYGGAEDEEDGPLEGVWEDKPCLC